MPSKPIRPPLERLTELAERTKADAAELESTAQEAAAADIPPPTPAAAAEPKGDLPRAVNDLFNEEERRMFKPEPDMAPVLKQTEKIKGCPKCGNPAPAQYGASGVARCICGWTGVM